MKPLVLASLISTFLVTVFTYGAFVFQPLETPPKEGQIGEIMFERSDFSVNNSKNIAISREAFLKFFSEGVFSSDFNTMEEIKKMPPDLNSEGGRNYCTGHFATLDGKIYAFNRYNPRALEVSDSKHKTGWFILTKR